MDIRRVPKGLNKIETADTINNNLIPAVKNEGIINENEVAEEMHEEREAIDETTCVKQSPELVMLEWAYKNCTFFRTPENRAYATVQMKDHQENWDIYSNHFALILSRSYYDATGKVPSPQSIQETQRNFEGEALFEASEAEIYVRNAGIGDAVYIDLCNPLWEQIKITKQGWQIISANASPARFKKAPGMLPLPYPSVNGNLEMLREMLNVEDVHDWVMLMSWIVGAMKPSGPYSIAVLQGEQGSGKSVTSRLLRDLIDPSTVPTRTLPRSEREFAISANNSGMFIFDNLSRLCAWHSDALCRMSTGGGVVTRALYTDDSEKLFHASRPIILNGIEDITTRHDLADRSLIVSLPPIPDQKRKTERQLIQEWEQKKPLILGALCTAVSTALTNQDSVGQIKLPRMADFAHWIIAAEPALPWENGTFLKEYNHNRERLVDIALEADPVAPIVVNFIETYGAFSGTATQLLTTLNQFAPKEVQSLRNYPKQPNMLSNKLRRCAPALRKKGIIFERSKSGQRNITLTKVVETTAVGNLLNTQPIDGQGGMGGGGGIVPPLVQFPKTVFSGSPEQGGM